jgi:hypothetical protein
MRKMRVLRSLAVLAFIVKAFLRAVGQL